LALDIADLFQALPEETHTIFFGLSGPAAEPSDHRHRRMLRARRERPRSRRAAERG